MISSFPKPMRDIRIVIRALQFLAPRDRHGDFFLVITKDLLERLPYTPPEGMMSRWQELSNAVNDLPDSETKQRMGAILEDRESAETLVRRSQCHFYGAAQHHVERVEIS